MSELIKQLAPAIWREIEVSKNILLHCHLNPDQDSIGSALATKFVLESLGKKVVVIKGDSELPSFTKYFPGGDQILEKNIFEIDLTQFDLFLILDSSDLDRVSRKGEIVFPANLKTVVIDHHASNTGFGQISLVETNYPATAQIMFDLFTAWGVKISPDSAICLMAGLQSDTGGFKYRGVNESTFKTAAELARIAPDFSKSLGQIFGSIDFKTTKFLGLGLNKSEQFFGGRVIISIINQTEFQKIGLEAKDSKNTGFSSMLRDIEGTEMAFAIIEDEPRVTRISARSRDGEKNDVAAILSHFGGGGHKVAAGATVNDVPENVKVKLLRILTEMLQ